MVREKSKERQLKQRVFALFASFAFFADHKKSVFICIHLWIIDNYEYWIQGRTHRVIPHADPATAPCAYYSDETGDMLKIFH